MFAANCPAQDDALFAGGLYGDAPTIREWSAHARPLPFAGLAEAQK